MLFFLLTRRPPRSQRTDPLFPYTALCRSMVLGFRPSVAYLVAIKAGNPAWIAPEQFARLATTVDGHGLPELAVILALGNGFIITSMLWLSTVVAMIDGRMLRADRTSVG